jgi:ATP-binding cassette, subfamily B, bacterial
MMKSDPERPSDDFDGEDDDEIDDDKTEHLRFSFADLLLSLGDLRRLLFPYLAERPRALWALAGCVLVEALFNVAFPLSLKYLVDAMIDDETRWGTLAVLLALLAGFGLIASVAMVGGEWLNARIGARAMSRLREDLFDRIQRVRLGYLERAQSGRILSRLSNDTGTIDDLTMHSVDWGVLPMLELVGGIALLFWLSPEMAVVAMAIFPLMLLGPRLFAPRAVEAGYILKRRQADALSAAGETLGAQKFVRAFGLQRRVATWYGHRNANARRAAVRVRFLEALIERSAAISILALHLVVFGIGAALAFNDEISVGTFIAFEAIFWELSYNFVHVTKYVPELINGAAAMRHLDEFRNAPSAAQDSDADAPAAPAFAREIRFENVRFSYDGARACLDGLSLSIKAGSRVAIVGESGSGKSTLLMLLLRLYQPQSGRISIDGIDMAAVSGASVRTMMATVFQDNVLFGTSVGENIRLGRPQATQADIVAAAKQAGIHRFIRSLPDGYDTVLGERGDTLSQGQRQRIGIARAMVRNPAILLLDEATSALDATTRTDILATLAKIGRERTLVTVTHDLASVVGYDRIYVLAQGRVVQEGCHADLVAIDGPYRRLWEQTPSDDAD